MKLARILIICFILFSCKLENQESNDKSEINDKKVVETVVKQENKIKPLDTVLSKQFDTLEIISPKFIDSLGYIFWKISSKEYVVLNNYRENTQIPKDEHSEIVTINKEKIIINFKNGGVDTLWNNLDNNGLDYRVKNYSKEENYLIVNYFDGETDFDLLVDLLTGKYIELYTFLKLSPNNKILVSYNYIEANPFQASGIMIMRFENGKKLIDMEIYEPKYFIKEFQWLNDTAGIIKIELYDKNYSVTEEIYSLLTVKK